MSKAAYPHLSMWTVFYNPSDFPGMYVARRFAMDKATADHKSGPSIEDVRSWIRESARSSGQGSLVRINRYPQDDPSVVETWL